MDRPRANDLWSRRMSGAELDRDEQRELLAALTENRGLRGDLLADRDFDGLLRALAATRWDDAEAFVAKVCERLATQEDTADADRFVAAVERRIQMEARRHPTPATARSRRFLVLLPAGAVALGLLALWLRAPSSPERRAGGVEATTAAPQPAGRAIDRPGIWPATVVRAEGTVLVTGARSKTPATAGTVIRAGRAVSTAGPPSAVALDCQDGSRLELGSQSHAVVLAGGGSGAGKHLFLATGTLRATIAPQPAGQPFAVTTPHAEIEVLGTRFSLTVSPRLTRLEVAEGRVRLSGKSGDQSREVTAGQQAALGIEPGISSTGSRGAVMFLVRSSVVLEPGDAVIKRHLEGMGFEVRVRSPGANLEADARASTMVMVSSTLESLDVNTGLRDVPVPLITWESGLFDDFGLTGPLRRSGRGGGEAGQRDDQSGELVIADATHPLAAGLHGRIRIAAGPSVDLRWGKPASSAVTLARYPDDPQSAAVFAYERGARMVGTTAPARRVALFLGEETAALLTDAGWAIFDAAVRWCSDERRPTDNARR